MDHPHRRLSTTGETLYKTLGLQKGATTDEIKRSYRKLALQLHPDKNPGDHEKSERFKDISKSYAILSDNSKKEIYDTYGSLGLYISEQFGEDNVRTYFMLMSPWVKIGMLLVSCLTGCCCCCCCFCCCCNFCCGKFKPPAPDGDFGDGGDVEYDNLEDETLVPRVKEGNEEPVSSEPVVVPNGTDKTPTQSPGTNSNGGIGDRDLNVPVTVQPSSTNRSSSPKPTEASPLKEYNGNSVPSYTTP